MDKIMILAIFATLAGTTLLAITGFTSTLAQTTMDNATMAGNMTGGNMTMDAQNLTDAAGSISANKKK
jgi:hypothetical protein